MPERFTRKQKHTLCSHDTCCRGPKVLKGQRCQSWQISFGSCLALLACTNFTKRRGRCMLVNGLECRPGVFLTAKADGIVDVWDLFVKQHEPVLAIQVQLPSDIRYSTLPLPFCSDKNLSRNLDGPTNLLLHRSCPHVRVGMTRKSCKLQNRGTSLW